MKMVLKVPMVCKKCKSCVLTIVSKVKGVKSMAYDEEKSTLTVVGEVDVVVVVDALRKGKHPATVVTVGDEKKEAEEKKKKDEEEKKKKEAEEKKKKECLEKMQKCCPKACPPPLYCPKACSPPRHCPPPPRCPPQSYCYVDDSGPCTIV
ncbi:heavy metal-associated isoprenylated plant protein 2-like [Triticum dicoccoides]|uniref:heavy metal-associated isoprenylated plant protein 2-like n=1 Tax=Triticum dicoccoides TaxID=85692 RepID=UPI00188EE827|nr:heavy metal-associated isoprenylated plant protein 2-like [Triticum dicoccoides]